MICWDIQIDCTHRSMKMSVLGGTMKFKQPARERGRESEGESD